MFVASSVAMPLARHLGALVEDVQSELRSTPSDQSMYTSSDGLVGKPIKEDPVLAFWSGPPIY